MLMSATPEADALNQATLKIDTYMTKGWQLDGMSIGLNNINHTTQKLALSMTSLKLPKPFDDIRFVNISCAVFVWRSDEIVCQQGHANLQSKRWQSLATDFVFSLNRKNSSLTLTHLKMLGGTLLVQANMHNNSWQVDVDAKNVDGKQLKDYLPSVPIDIKDGKASFKLTASGVASDVKQLTLNTVLIQAKAKSKDGQFSTENLALNNQLTATNNQGVWHWQNHADIHKGALYADPVHFEVGTKPIVIDAKGLWNANNKQVSVQSFALKNMKVANGEVFVQANMHDKHWQLDVDAKNVNGKQLKSYFPKLPLQFKSGKANAKLMASGVASDVQQVKLSSDLIEVTVQNKNGEFATEKLSLNSQLAGQNDHGLWQWQTHSSINKGALYVDPVYLEVATKPVVIDAKGQWNAKNKRVIVENINYQHPDAAVLTGTGVISYARKIQLEKADLDVTSLGLQNLFSVYIKPYFDPATVEGVSLEGNVNAHFDVVQQILRGATVNFDKLTVKDTGHRLRVKEGSGLVNWSSKPFPIQLSHLAWQSMSLFNLPIGPAQVELSAWANNFRLSQSARLPFLGGTITANQLSWYAKPQEEPDIAFTGKIDNVSLEKLSKVMNWTPLSGKISGHIPGVSYRDKTLRLGGELSVNVFDGTIKLTNLASVGLFSDYPVVYSDFVLDNLDLDQITRKFSFGNITGRLSGSVKQLTLENWHPTHFFAWLGTPDNDDSRHRISQKAVQNIASIGGGGAADILSRSFLSLFDTFGYDKIGVGCYLNKGVCQMMGVETTPQGYYLIRGGGLPRIDVMGYNPQVDWAVLVERLGRISTTEEVIVK
jgi:hypothetical protein